jgi:hypothetical protein
MRWVKYGLPLAALVAGLFTGFGTGDFLAFAARMGYRIPQDYMAYDYSTAVLWAVAFGASILLWPVPLADKRPLLTLWIVRCLVTLGFMLIYEEHYGLDAYWYFRQSRVDVFPWADVELGKGSVNITAMTWAFRHYLPVAGSYHAIKVIYSMFGMVGTYVIYMGVRAFLGHSDHRILYLLGLFPSLLFWSSILGKDPVNYLGVSLYFYGVLAWCKRPRYRYIIPIALGTFIAMTMRAWYGIIFVAPLAAMAIQRVKSAPARLVFIALASGMFAVSYAAINEKYGLETGKDVVSTTHGLSRGWASGGSSQEVPEFRSVGQMLAFAPKGMFAALYRPLPGEVFNIFGLLSGFENLVLLWLLWTAIRRAGKAALREPIVLWALVLTLVWSFFYAFISYQNLGSAVRFRLQILPVLLLAPLYLIHRFQPEKAGARNDEYDVRNSGIPGQLSEI